MLTLYIGLGPTATMLQDALSDIGSLHKGTFEKTKFGMLTPEVQNLLADPSNATRTNVVIAGIEARI